MADAQLEAGDSFGPYKLEAMLGRGGMGEVYKALTPGGEPVALKLIRSEYARDEVFRARFDREGRIAETISNPHLVPVLDRGVHGPFAFMAQRFIAGGSLADRLEREGKLSVEESLRICDEVAQGLDALHAAGLVHRDIKPANILLDEEGRAYVTDFGLARDIEGTVLTSPGSALGSMENMAPEQIRGEDVSAATDVYALGCVAYLCLTGAAPFASWSGMRIMWAHLQQQPPDPAEKCPELPRALCDVLLSALAKEPEQRPRSATEFAASLRGAAAS